MIYNATNSMFSLGFQFHLMSLNLNYILAICNLILRISVIKTLIYATKISSYCENNNSKEYLFSESFIYIYIRYIEHMKNILKQANV